MRERKNKNKTSISKLRKIKYLERFTDEELELIDYFLLNLSYICYKIDINERK